MTRIFTFATLSGLILFFSVSMPVHANLINLGLYTNYYQTQFGIFEPVIYDDVNQQYWFSPLNQTGGTFDEQMDFVNKLNNDSAYQNALWGTWHMASSSDMQALLTNPLSQITSHFFQTDDSWPHLGTWDGRFNQLPDDSSTDSHGVLKVNYVNNMDPDNPLIIYSTESGYVSDLLSGWMSVGALGAWIVADSTVPVPEPSTILLLSLGLVCFAAFRRRFSA